MSQISQVVAGAAVLGVAGLGYAAGIERTAFVLRRYTVPVLAPGAPPVRVLHLSDMHLLPRQHRKIAWIRQLEQLEPDLVVHTGDFIAHEDGPAAVAEAFGSLLDRPGVFVLGSNDYFSPKLKNPGRYLTADHTKGLATTPRLPTEDLVELLTGRGWQHLGNRRVRLEVGGLDVELVGVDDPHLGYDRYGEVAGAADPAAVLTVGVMHAPYQRILDAMALDGARLLLAGHTHGGQLCVPGYGALVTNCDLDTRRAKGLSRWWPGAGHRPSSQAPADAAWLEVSAGLGTSPFAPVRFACRPEASLLTLVPGPATADS